MPTLPPLRMAVGGVFLLGVLTRIAGLIREAIIADRFGVSAGLDVVLLAIAVPIAFAVAAGGGLARAVVPLAAGLRERQLGAFFRASGRRVVATGTGGALLLAATAWAWTRVVAPGLEDGARGQLVLGAAIASLGLAGGSLAGLCVGLTNARGAHLQASLNPILYNVVIIAALLALAPSQGAMALLYGIVLAEWSQLILLLPPLARLRPGRVSPRVERLLDALHGAFVPAALLGLAAGANTIIDRAFAVTVGEGAVSALAYADRLLNLPVGLVGMAVATPLYTRLSRFAAARQSRAFRDTLALGVLGCLVLGGAMAAMAWGTAEPAIALLLMRGKFGVEEVLRCSEALQFYSPAIVPLTLAPLVQSAAFAKGRRWTALSMAGGGAVLNAVLNAVLAPSYGVAGIAAATSIASWVSLLGLTVIVAPWLFRRPLLLSVAARALACTAGIAACLWLARLGWADNWRHGAGPQVLMLLAGSAIPALLLSVAFERIWGPMVPRVLALRQSVALAATRAE